MINPVTGWFEIKAIMKPDSATVMDAFHGAWLCRYPQPKQIGFDNGSEFKDVFAAMCKNYSVKEKHSTSHNPQSNRVIEHIHQVLPIQFQADWARIKLRKQETIDKSNAQENAKRIDHDYQVGNKVLLECPGIICKMPQPRKGLYKIIKVHANGTVRIRQGSRGHIITEQVNIRRLQPYFKCSN